MKGRCFAIIDDIQTKSLKIHSKKSAQNCFQGIARNGEKWLKFMLINKWRFFNNAKIPVILYAEVCMKNVQNTQVKHENKQHD